MESLKLKFGQDTGINSSTLVENALGFLIWAKPQFCNSSKRCSLQEHPLLGHWLYRTTEKSAAFRVTSSPAASGISLEISHVKLKAHSLWNLIGSQCKVVKACISIYVHRQDRRKGEGAILEREGGSLIAYHYLGVTNSVLRDCNPVSALFPMWGLIEYISDSYSQLHSAASVASICCYNIPADSSYLQSSFNKKFKEI